MTLLEILGMVLLTATVLSVAWLAVAVAWRQLRGGRNEHATDEILDRLDQIELRLAAVSERLLPRDSGDSEDSRASETVVDGHGGDPDAPPPADRDDPA